ELRAARDGGPPPVDVPRDDGRLRSRRDRQQPAAKPAIRAAAAAVAHRLPADRRALRRPYRSNQPALSGGADAELSANEQGRRSSIQVRVGREPHRARGLAAGEQRRRVLGGVRYAYSSLFGDYKKALAPRIGVAWDVDGGHRTIVKADYGLFFDRNLLAAAATVPEKGGVFTKAAFDVALPRLGVDYSGSLI